MTRDSERRGSLDNLKTSQQGRATETGAKGLMCESGRTRLTCMHLLKMLMLSMGDSAASCCKASIVSMLLQKNSGSPTLVLQAYTRSA